MSDDLISKGSIYKKIAEREDLARKRVLDTPTNSPCYMRYVAQLNERTALKHMIADEPTIEAEPVVHGRWTGKGFVYECSVCRKREPESTKEYADLYWHYCPNCGAKMDGGDQDEQAAEEKGV